MTLRTCSLLFMIAISLFLWGCSTPQKSRLATTAAGAFAGALIGSATAPKDERPELHSAYWAAILGLGAAMTSNFIFDETHELEKTRLENDKLKKELDLFQTGDKVLVKEGQGRFRGQGPDSMFQSGKAKWKLFEVDRWQKDGPNRLLHIDKMIEIQPEP